MGYHASAALSNRENWISPCMQDLATCLPINLKFHPVTLYVMNGGAQNPETVSTETVVRRCMLGGFMIRRTWVCESESGIGGALNSNNSSVVCARKKSELAKTTT